MEAETWCVLPFALQNELQTVLEETRAFVLHVWFLTTELWRKMWSVNAVIWLCNATDCSGSGKVTYLLGWHDWPVSADVWRQASFWSAAEQLCPWAVLVPVRKPGDFYLPVSAYSLYSNKFLTYFSKTYLAHSEYWYADKWNFSFSWKLNNFKESIHRRFRRLK